MEQNLRKCKACNELKNRILIGKFDDKNKKYTDETGKLWNGSTCPICHKNKIKSNMQVKRSAQKC